MSYYDCERNKQFHKGQKVLDCKGRERLIEQVLTGTSIGMYILDGGELVSVCQIKVIGENDKTFYEP